MGLPFSIDHHPMKKTNVYLNRIIRVIQLPPHYLQSVYSILYPFIYPIFLTSHRYQLTLNLYQNLFDSYIETIRFLEQAYFGPFIPSPFTLEIHPKFPKESKKSKKRCREAVLFISFCVGSQFLYILF